MFEECPFNYAIAATKWMFFLIKTKNKLKHLLMLINGFQCFMMITFVYKHRSENFGVLVFVLQTSATWINVVVSDGSQLIVFFRKISIFFFR